MPYVQNTEEDQKAMLEVIGVDSIESLFAAIPADLRLKSFEGIPNSVSEADVIRDLQAMGLNNRTVVPRSNFLGGGIEKHFIPHIVDHISLDGNFITAYTPYQPEVSQGTLTAIFEFQTMMSELTGLPVSNASLYDGATAVAEAMMVSYHWSQKAHRKENRRRCIVPDSLHPEFQQTITTYAQSMGIELVFVGFNLETGRISRTQFKKAMSEGGVMSALLPYPNFFGVVDDITDLVESLHAVGALAVAVCHPLALSVFKSPAEFGCDIAVGEGQSLGCYQALGGPAFGFFSCTQELIRHAPGRIVSETVDKAGTRAFSLALATREQHIRREKATSNICTNQALMALRACIYMASLGRQGFIELGESILSNAAYAADELAKAGVERRFEGSTFFNEFVVMGPDDLIERGRQAGLVAGLHLGRFHEQYKNQYLLTFSEMNTKESIDRLVELFKS